MLPWIATHLYRYIDTNKFYVTVLYIVELEVGRCRLVGVSKIKANKAKRLSGIGQWKNLSQNNVDFSSFSKDLRNKNFKGRKQN